MAIQVLSEKEVAAVAGGTGGTIIGDVLGLVNGLIGQNKVVMGVLNGVLKIAIGVVDSKPVSTLIDAALPIVSKILVGLHIF